MRLQAQGIAHRAVPRRDRPEPGRVRRRAARPARREAVKVDLALRAVADAEDIEVDRRRGRGRDRPRGRAHAARSRTSVRKAIERNGQIPAVRSDLRKRKALEWLVEHVEVVDEGQPIDRADLELADRRATTEATDAEATETEATETDATETEAKDDE